MKSTFSLLTAQRRSERRGASIISAPTPESAGKSSSRPTILQERNVKP
nr:MAG TPA: hypothetical protein [Caudoviricetes sp.]